MRILDVDAVAPAEASALTGHLLADEAVHAAFQSPTGAVIFTEGRIVLIQRESLLEEKIETSSFSYRAVHHFALTEGAAASSRTALRIWLGAEPQPLHLRAGAGTDLTALQRLLAAKIG